MRKPFILFLLSCFLSAPSVTSAKKKFATLSGADQLLPAPGGYHHWPQFAWKDGYDLHGYTANGLVVRAYTVFRYVDDHDEDQDWNFSMHAIDAKTCPDGQSIFGRDCATERLKFVEYFWHAMGYRLRLLTIIKLVIAEPWKVWKNAAWAKKSKVTKVALQKAKEYLEEVIKPNCYQIENWGTQPVFSGSAGCAQTLIISRAHVLGKKKDKQNWAMGKHLWDMAMKHRHPELSPTKAQAEVSISNYSKGTEAKKRAGLMAEADLMDCNKDNAEAGLCNKPLLLFGMVTTDGNHDGGRPELHPLRALVDRDGWSFSKKKKNEVLNETAENYKL